MGLKMTKKEEFTQRALVAFNCAKAEGDDAQSALIIEALAREYGIPADYPARD
jgi:hypothetical protein